MIVGIIFLKLSLMLQILDFIGTCVSKDVAKIARRYGRPSSYKNAVKSVINFDEGFESTFDLRFRNPWDSQTNIKTIKGVKYLHLVHSQIDYIFIIENGKHRKNIAFY